MAVTGRFVLLIAAGLIPMLLWPQAAIVRLWWLGALLLVAVDVALASAPGRLAARREPVEPVRLGETHPQPARRDQPHPAYRPRARPRRLGSRRQGRVANVAASRCTPAARSWSTSHSPRPDAAIGWPTG
jgi:hypothetical protein